MSANGSEGDDRDRQRAAVPAWKPRVRSAGTGILGVVVWLGLSGCAEAPVPASLRQPAGPPPGWLDQPSAANDVLCAVGVSGPTYFPDEALGNSKAQALTELARAVRVRVTSEMDVNVSGGAEHFQTRITERAKLETDAVVEKAQVRAQWVNPGGYPTRGEQGTVYTLVCAPVRQPPGAP